MSQQPDYTCTDTHNGQKRALDPLEVVTGCCELPKMCWEPNCSPLEKQGGLLNHFSSPIYLVLWDRVSLTGTQHSPSGLGWLAREPQDYYFFYLPRAGSVHYHVWFVCFFKKHGFCSYRTVSLPPKGCNVILTNLFTGKNSNRILQLTLIFLILNGNNSHS